MFTNTGKYEVVTKEEKRTPSRTVEKCRTWGFGIKNSGVLEAAIRQK